MAGETKNKAAVTTGAENSEKSKSTKKLGNNKSSGNKNKKEYKLDRNGNVGVKKQISKSNFKKGSGREGDEERDLLVKKVDRNKTEFLKSQNVKKNWLILDASGRPLGRVAALAASLLRGKHKVDFTPNVDCGDGVIIINCKDTVLTGRKLYQKVRYRHSGWIGGIKEIKYSVLMKTKPQEAMAMAVRGMLPHNSLGRKMAKHLRTYKDGRHENEAQNPQIYEF